MLLIICYASWRVTRATNVQPGRSKRELPGAGFEIDERNQEEGGTERRKEGEREREVARARDPYSDALRSIEDEQHDFEL